MKKRLKKNLKNKKNRPKRSVKQIFAKAGIVLGTLLLISGTGIGCIYVHDQLIQAPYFNAKTISVTGNDRLTPDLVEMVAGVSIGVNVLSVNLEAARKRLETHPWIEKAAINRVLPDNLSIEIKEHRAIARVNVSGSGYLMNTTGKLFKAVDGDDPPDIPVVTGLQVRDIREKQMAVNTPFGSVFWLLSREDKSPKWLGGLPLKSIDVDPELGITVQSIDTGGPQIHVGYGPYQHKWKRLSAVRAYAAANNMTDRITQINLRTPNRIVVKLLPKGPDAMDQKEA